MLTSMTGYGEATCEGKNFVISVELKSVNNRFLKISTKIPEEVSYLQNDLEEDVRKRVSRGSVLLTVRFLPTRIADLYEIDEEVLSKYLNKLNALKKVLGTTEEILLKDLVLLPGVVRMEEELILGKGEVLPAALKATREAVEKLTRMRCVEGSHLEVEFRKRSALVSKHLDEIKKHAPKALEEYQARLEERINQLLSQKGVSIAHEDLLKEAAILAERSDIAEEIQRLESHLLQFVATLDENDAVGRKLEFIVQEMFRESNTMSAKSTNTAMNQRIVEIKAEVDRMKEQVVNVE